jgi:DNA-binding transcriptional MerR regulator
MDEKREVSSTQVKKVARQSGVETHVVRYCVEVGLVAETLGENDLRELRRVRRLKTLGVNMAGVEIILRMRRKIKALQDEIEHLRAG